MTPREIIYTDLEEIYIGNLNTVDADLDLPQKGRCGSTFRWESKEILFISHEGKVTRPTHGVGNRKVLLVVTAFLGEEKAEKIFEATVLEEPRKIKVTKILEVRTKAVIHEKAELPSVAIIIDENKNALTLPVIWNEYDAMDKIGELHITGWIEEIKQPVPAIITYTNKKEQHPQTPKENPIYSPMHVHLKDKNTFYDMQNKMILYLESVDDDQMLYNFRKVAELDTKEAPPMTGWDAPKSNLRGHTTGHYLSALALAFNATEKYTIKEKIDYIIEQLRECQCALEHSGCHTGFLSAYSEEQFDLLEKFTTYPAIWAPYYTLDKIMSGLYDCYTLAGNEMALHLLIGMGDWVYNRLSNLSNDQRKQMWSMYIAGEFGGMIGTMVKLYEITQEHKYLLTAKMFENDKLFYPMSENIDTLQDMHANQHIPQIIGAIEIYKATGEEKWLKIAQNFWNFVTQNHSYTIGGTGETEMFHLANHLIDYLSEKTAESCASYNMLRLTSELFKLNPNSGLMDYYENVLYNHIIATASHSTDGGTTYFMPLSPGSQKVFNTDENTCCHGTGLESRFRYMNDIYTKRENVLYVNLYIPSELKSEDLFIEQSEKDSEQFIFRIMTDIEKEICFRIPKWAKEYFVSINGNKLFNCKEDGYIHINKQWSKEDVIIVYFKPELRLIHSPDNFSYSSIAYGPYILAELSDENDFRSLPDVLSQEWKKSAGKLIFEIRDRIFIPLYAVNREKHHVYFKND